jgi:8-oxo-dGTP diphosphatase
VNNARGTPDVPPRRGRLGSPPVTYAPEAVPVDAGPQMWKRHAARLWRWLPGWARRALLWRLNAHFLVGTVAVVRDAQGRTLIARHTYRRYAPWALPGGWVRRGEDPATAVVREILEETDLRVEVIAPLLVQRESPAHLTVIFAARLIGGTFRPSGEVSEVRFVDPGTYPPGLREDHRAVLDAVRGHPLFALRPPYVNVSPDRPPSSSSAQDIGPSSR